MKHSVSQRMDSTLRLGGVAAYSTLGKLSDPIVSSMMNWDDVQLVAVLFHELAHQLLYVKGNSGFNESFATAVEEFGVHRWLEAQGATDDIGRYESSRQRRQELMDLVAAARTELEKTYAADLPIDQKRRVKKARLQSLADSIAALFRSTGRDPGGWIGV